MAQRTPALSYGMLLVGGIGLYAAIHGDSFAEVLGGKGSPLLGPFPSAYHGAAAGAGPQTTAYMTSAATGTHLSGAGYVNPIGAGWAEGRTDQGVDFAPSHTGAPLYAPGNAEVVKLGAPGWPSGEKGLVLKLLDGPLAGQFVYMYEAVEPTVRLHQVVSAGQQVAQGVFGETGLEIGFSDANGVPLSHSEYTEGKVTKWGTKMREWLAGLAHPKKTAPFRARTV